MFEFLNRTQNRITITDTLMDRIKKEELNKNSFVKLQVEIQRNNKSKKNQLFTGFLYTEKPVSAKERIQISDEDFQILKGGRLDFDGVNILYYPDIDLVWKITKNPNIHVVIANRKFAETPIAFELKNREEMDSHVKTTFYEEGVVSIYVDGNTMSLEFESHPLTKESEENLSEAILLEFTKWNRFIFR